MIDDEEAKFGYPTEAQGKVPSFSSREEEAEFWDTHDLVELFGESGWVPLNASPELAERVTVRLDQTDRLALERYARKIGVGPSTLARMWLKERLNQEAEQGKKAS